MADVVDPATRSRMMAGIGAKNTRPEVALRKALHAKGLRFRIHARKLPGKPDIVLAKWKVAVLVHGCFWHRHEGCKYATLPKTSREFWVEKFASNKRRDLRNLDDLRSAGWRTATIWECALRQGRAAEVATRITEWLTSAESAIEVPAASGALRTE